MTLSPPLSDLVIANNYKRSSSVLSIFIALSLCSATFAAAPGADIEGALSDRVYITSSESKNSKTATTAVAVPDVLGKTNPAWKNSVLASKEGLVNQIVITLGNDSAVIRGAVSKVTELRENANRYELERAFAFASDSSAQKGGEALAQAVVAVFGEAGLWRVGGFDHF
jgi:hypothetical protein